MIFTAKATIVGLHDGDTVTGDLDVGWHVTLTGKRIRVAHINAPELATPAGAAALEFAKTLVKPGDVLDLVSTGLDKYGRTLGSLRLADGRDFAGVMVAAGHAVPYEGGAR